MKRPAISVFLLLGLLTASSSLYAIPFSTDEATQALLANRLKASYPQTALPQHEYDAIHLDIQFEFPSLDLDSAQFQVEQVAVVMVNELNEYEFNLEGARILAMQLDGAPASWAQDADTVRLQLNPSKAIGETLRVLVSYKVPVQTETGFKGLTYISSEDVMYSFGEPWGTRRWLACWDQPGDKVTSRVSGTLPAGYSLVSNGELETAPVPHNAGGTTIWNNETPISTYLISLAIRHYARHDAGTAGVHDTPIAYWVYPEDSTAQVEVLKKTPQMLAYFESLFGQYPFSKYDQAVALINGGSAGMEHQTATTIGTQIVNCGDDRYENLIAHELAHSWWGNSVGLATYRDNWLKEGFASYAEVLWAESLSKSDLDRSLLMHSTFYFNDESSKGPVALYDPPTDRLFSSTIYHKGSLVLHMLRWVMGDEDFFAGLQEYAAEYQYGSTTTAGFKAVMESTSGLDLSEFFDQWVNGIGHPEYVVSSFYTDETASGWYVNFQLGQEQEVTNLFSIPLPVRFYSETGDTTIVVQTMASQDQLIEVSGLTFEPTGIELDPDNWILDEQRVGGVEESKGPYSFEITPAWPNPFNSTVSLQFSLDNPANVKIEVFDLLGRSVEIIRDHRMNGGTYRMKWQPRDEVASGLYFLRVQIGDQLSSQRLVYLR